MTCQAFSGVVVGCLSQQGGNVLYAGLVQESRAQMHDMAVDMGPEGRNVRDNRMRNFDRELYGPVVLEQDGDKEVEVATGQVPQDSQLR